MVTDELQTLLLKFVNANANVADVQWDRRMSPKLLFNPYSNNYEERKTAAHYFLQASSLLDDNIIGFSENARRILVDLHQKFGNRLFEIRKPHLFQEEIIKCKFYRDLGHFREAIPEILTSVNEYVRNTIERDLIGHSRKFAKPKDFVDDISRNIEKMKGPNREKAWIYMRWMVRPEPDLGIFTHFSPQDLHVPLTRETASVATSLGLINSAAPFLWRDEYSETRASEIITNFAKQMFPKDPARVDYPFFLLGRWLKQKNLNRNTLKDALQFFELVHEETGKPHAYYQSLSRYKSGWEKKTAVTLSKMKISYGYEPISFPLPGDTYTPDFILDKSIQGRKIVLEPHYEMSRRQSLKYSLFKRTYGQEFLLILLLKNDLIPFYHQRNILNDDVCDDVWPIEYVELLVDKIRTGTYGQ